MSVAQATARPLELLAPAGSYPALAAAIRAGADSVYFGIDRLNMRSRASGSFKIEDLRRIARICHWCRVRCYLTLNTVVYDSELEEVENICSAAADAGVDAVIAMDFAAIRAARRHGLPVHISVQANIANLEAVRHYSEYSDLVVLARELTLERIASIAEGIEAENIRGPSGDRLRLEVFVHGALCVAISGKCYMSLALYNSSANRGECLQACRRGYMVEDAETGDRLEIDNNYVMSPRDLCMLAHLDRLVEAGVGVFKIEGRARSANYVSVVTAAYRRALDEIGRGTYSPEIYAEEISELERVFNRGFWQGGYYCGERLGEWSRSGHSQATQRRIQLGIVANCFARIGVIEFELWQKELSSGSRILVEGPTTGAVEAVAPELRVDGKTVSRAVKGERVTIAMPAKCRRNDKVFLLQEV